MTSTHSPSTATDTADTTMAADTSATDRRTTELGARHAVVDTGLGPLLLVADGPHLVGVYFDGHTYPPEEASIGGKADPATDPVLSVAADQLRAYLTGERTTFSVPVRTDGDAFSTRVWDLLRRIPFGTTTTYGALATELGNPALAQRVGQAVGHNPVSIVIPCHRVVGADGSLTGFAGGLERKRILLALEEPEPDEAGRLF